MRKSPKQERAEAAARIAELTAEWRKKDAEFVRMLTEQRETFPVEPHHSYDKWGTEPFRPGWHEWCRSVGLKRKTADAIIDRKSVLPRGAR